jgi:hypothetical protein
MSFTQAERAGGKILLKTKKKTIPPDFIRTKKNLAGVKKRS